MAAYLDPYLAGRLRAAGLAGLVEAVIVVRAQAGPDLAADDGGLARRVIERAAARAGEPPAAARYFPRANAVVITAGARLLQEILCDPDLAAASAPDLDPLWMLQPGEERENGQ